MEENPTEASELRSEASRSQALEGKLTCKGAQDMRGKGGLKI